MTEASPIPKTSRSRRRRHWLRAILVLSIIGLLLINLLAFIQAWSMTHFVAAGSHTLPPEALSSGQKVWVLLTGVRIPRPQKESDPASIGLPFDIRHVHDANGDLELWHIPSVGQSSGLVMMYHAYVSTKSSLLAAAAEFHAMGYEVEMVDFPGSGGSTGNDTTLGYREALDVLATITDAPQPQVGKPLILYGQSMGAAALLRAVGELHAPADGIIIESPYDRLLSTVQVRFQAMHVPAFPLSQLLVFWGGLQHGYWGFGMNPSDFATHIHCPVLMFHGGLDARVTDDEASAVFSNFAGPRQLERFANAPHCAFLSTDPARWETAVRALLSEAIRYAGSMR